MKKRAILFFCILASTMIFLAASVYAATLDNFSISQSKSTLKPGEEVKFTVNFGAQIASYDMEFTYDNTKLEYVSVTGGQANNTGTKVLVSYYDPAGGNTPIESMSITFKAKSTITSATTDNVRIAISSLAGPDLASYEDIIDTKTVTIQPETTITPPAEEPQTTNNENAGGTSTGTENALVPNEANETKETKEKAETKEETPKTLPKTGMNLYGVCFTLLGVLAVCYALVARKK